MPETIPRSDHEYLRVKAVNTNGRRQLVMLGISYGDPVYFSLQFQDDDESFSCEAPDAFTAFNTARKQYEPKGWRFLCNGARRDCYAFGSQLAADLGENVYQLVKGRPASNEDLVGIFWDADESAIGTVNEQRACYEAWCK